MLWQCTTCGACENELRFRAICAGTTVPCPHCGTLLLLPGKRALGGESVMLSQFRASPELAALLGRKRRGRGRTVATILTTLIVLAVIGGVGYFVLKQSLAPPPAGKDGEPAKDAGTPKPP